MKRDVSLLIPRLDFQPFCEPAFLAPHHGWTTGLPIVLFDQSQPSLLKSSRLPCDWSILSLVYPTWRMSVLMSFFLLQSVFQSAFTSTNLGQSQQDAVLNLLKGKDVLVSQPTARGKFVIFSLSRSYASSKLRESNLLVVLWLPLSSTRLCRAKTGSLLQ